MPLFWIGGNQNASLSNQFAYTYYVNVEGSNIVARNEQGTQISSNADTQVVLEAIDTDRGSSPTRVQFGEGTFNFLDSVGLNAQDLEICGMGKGVTLFTLDAAYPNSNNATLLIYLATQAGTTRGLDAVSKGDNTVTLTTGTQEDEFEVNDYINVISTDTIGTAGLTNGEMHRIRSITSDDTGVITLMDNIEGGTWTSPSVVEIQNVRQNFTLKDLSIQDLRASASNLGTADALRLRNVDHVTIDNVEFIDNIFTAILLEKCFHVIITNCFVNRVVGSPVSKTVGTDTRYGFNFQSCDQWIVSNSEGHDLRHFVATNCSSVNDASEGWCQRGLVISNTVTQMDSSALDSHQGTRNCIYANNNIFGSYQFDTGSGIGVRGEQMQILNNNIGGCAEGVVLFSDIDASVDPNIISGNYINTALRGISVQQSVSNLIITNNHINLQSTGAVFGINLIRGASTVAGNDTIICNNWIDGDSDVNVVGIQLDSQVNVIIQGNYIKDCNVPIDVNDTDGTIANVQICNNLFEGNTNDNVSLGSLVRPEVQVYDNLNAIDNTIITRFILPDTFLAVVGTPVLATNTFAVPTPDFALKEWLFDPSSEETISAMVGLDPTYDGGTIEFRVHYYRDGGSAGETVNWGVACGTLADGRGIESATLLGTEVTVTDTVQGFDSQAVTAFFTVTPANAAAGDNTLAIALTRDPAADTLSVDANMIMLEYRYGVTSRSAT